MPTGERWPLQGLPGPVYILSADWPASCWVARACLLGLDLHPDTRPLQLAPFTSAGTDRTCAMSFTIRCPPGTGNGSDMVSTSRKQWGHKGAHLHRLLALKGVGQDQGGSGVSRGPQGQRAAGLAQLAEHKAHQLQARELRGGRRMRGLPCRRCQGPQGRAGWPSAVYLVTSEPQPRAAVLVIWGRPPGQAGTGGT